MEADGISRIYDLYMEDDGQHVEEVYPRQTAQTTDSQAVQAVARRVDIACGYLGRGRQSAWKIHRLAPWIEERNVPGLTEGAEIPVPAGTESADEYRVMAEIFEKLLQPRGLDRLFHAQKPGLTITIS